MLPGSSARGPHFEKSQKSWVWGGSNQEFFSPKVLISLPRPDYSCAQRSSGHPWRAGPERTRKARALMVQGPYLLAHFPLKGRLFPLAGCCQHIPLSAAVPTHAEVFRAPECCCMLGVNVNPYVSIPNCKQTTGDIPSMGPALIRKLEIPG